MFIRKIKPLLAVFLLGMFGSLPVSAQVTKLEDFVKVASKRKVQISPDGKHYSVVYRKDQQEAIAIFDTDSRKPIKAFRPRGRSKGVGEVYWVNNSRLVYGVTESYSWDKTQRDTGELIGINIDGSGHKMIFGRDSGESELNTLINKKESSYGDQEIIDLLKNDEKHILIAFYPWKVEGKYFVHNPYVSPTVYKLNIYNGKKRLVEHLPIPGASAITDNTGKVRFAIGINKNDEQVIAYKKETSDEWDDFSLNDFNGYGIQPLSFTEDNKNVYVSARGSDGMRGLFLLNLESHAIEPLFRDSKVDISKYVTDFAERRVVAVGTRLALPQYHYLDNADAKAKVHKLLMRSFQGFDISITSATEDQSKLIVFAHSDTNPGDYYLFDTKTKGADFLFTQRTWIDLNNTVPMKSMEFTTRDGTTIYGYLTLPKEKSQSFPLVVLPHGGPHYVRDHWQFDWEVQLLASRGYAVLQVNYRGSGGYGAEFQTAGYGKWGTLMIDDIADATKSVIEHGAIDPDRICIFGHSYGGYAALMGAVRNPNLYKCSIGSMGVYNLPMMFNTGNIPKNINGIAYLKRALGTDVEEQKSNSPVHNVEKIKANVLLVHGGADSRVPIEQAESLKGAFEKINKEYEWLEIENEGHGYYDEGNRYTIYAKVLDFLDKNIGNKVIRQAKN